MTDPRLLLRQMFDAAVAAAQPSHCLPPHLPAPPPPGGRTLVIGAGKASAEMARVLEQHWPGPLTGLVVTRYGYAVPCARIEIVEAAHPVPDAAGMAAAQRMLAMVGGLTADDLVICLISGGGSSLLALPLPGISLADKQDINRALLRSGATISEMNCVRRHLSAVKGGRLAAACHPARVVTLLISDVPGDDPADIASGPTSADRSTCADALAILARYGIAVPENVHALLENGVRGGGQGDGGAGSDAGGSGGDAGGDIGGDIGGNAGGTAGSAAGATAAAIAESVKPGDPRLAGHELRMIVTPQLALEAAARVAAAAGVAVHILGDSIEGEAREVGIVMAGIARQVATRGQPFVPPCILLSGGETTVTVRGAGRGGRNVEFLLSLALALHGLPGVYAIACDTDGVDGQEDIAGALLTPDTLARAWALGIKPRERLADNDGHGFFQALGDAVISGPTLTNVNDFRAIYVGPPAGP